MKNLATNILCIIEVPDIDVNLNGRNNQMPADIENEQQQEPEEITKNNDQMAVLKWLLRALTAKPNSDLHHTILKEVTPKTSKNG